MNSALEFERDETASLDRFLTWFSRGTVDVQRDPGQPANEVRVMTVHGAKGLEAPVVFLPDTMQLPNLPETLLWAEREGLPLWCPRRDLAVPFYTAERQALRARQLQERKRLASASAFLPCSLPALLPAQT